jgi:hypothetical protein
LGKDSVLIMEQTLLPSIDAKSKKDGGLAGLKVQSRREPPKGPVLGGRRKDWL